MPAAFDGEIGTRGLRRCYDWIDNIRDWNNGMGNARRMAVYSEIPMCLSRAEKCELTFAKYAKFSVCTFSVLNAVTWLVKYIFG